MREMLTAGAKPTNRSAPAPQLTWLEVSVLAFFGGIYNATRFDRDVIPEMTPTVRDNYAPYVLRQLEPKLGAVASLPATPSVEPTAGDAGQPY
jgi:hypothetical protein